ncbi:MAG TPA: VWA domain-containing protein [bacterium]|jgi:hypothetical protein
MNVTFGFPAALWVLALLPVIVLLYMLRARRVDQEVSSVLLWRRARQDLAAQRPVRRLERNILLLLQLLAVALAAIALARPQVPVAGGGRATVLVLDTSASMQATDVAPSRFAAAVAAARDAASRAAGPVMLIEAGSQPRVAVPFARADAVGSALAALRPTDGPARLQQAIALALGQRTGAGVPRVLVFTDRAGPAFPDVLYHVLGASAANVAVAAVHTEAGAGRTHVLIRLRRFAGTAGIVPLELRLGGRVVLQRSVLLPADGSAVVSATVDGSGVLEARVRVRDALELDNTAAAVVGGPLARVLILGAPDRALAEALAVMPVKVAAAEQATSEQLAAADLVVLDRMPPVALPPGNFLLIGTLPTNLPVSADGTVRRPSVLRTAASHPVMRYVDLSGLQILQSANLQVRGGEILAEGEVPLIWAYDGNGIRVALTGFTLDQSDFALQVAFPIFLQNAVSWLVGTDAVLTAGSPLIVPAGEQTSAILDGPGGQATLQAAGGRFVVPSLDRAGVYTLRTGTRIRTFAVVPPPEESDLAPIVASPGAIPGAAPSDARRVADLWPVLTAGLLLILVVEWILWLRGLPRTRGAAVPVRR